MSQFINDREDVVTTAIDGLLRTAGDRLARLDGYPHIRVVVRSDWRHDRVALVSGGGSGHEPSHAGFVGRGLLSAAVCGDVFASPSVDAVLAGILAVTGDAGCLLIVKNYTGDRLNFGLAAERARAVGRRVEMVIVDDDIALPDLPQARGLAGTLFVHKIAGALAEAGEPLEVVAAAARRAIDGVVSIGLSLGTCTVPGSPREERVAAGRAELGLGIHGEPGVEQIDFERAGQALQRVVDKLAAHLGDGQHVALLNNLGGSTPLEMSILTDELARSSIGPRLSWLVGPAALMTSLDMHGFSLSVLPLDRADEALLLAPVEPECTWPGLRELRAIEIVAMPHGMAPDRAAPSTDAARQAFLIRCLDILAGCEGELNALDAKSGDGDTGSTLAGAARALHEALPALPLADEAALLRSIGLELSQTMGGSSGVLMAIFFAAAGDARASDHGLTQALQSGLQRIGEIGGAQPGDRTLIDALQPALDALDDGLPAAAAAARAGADATASITVARAGRASYVGADRLAGHNDPGAEAIARLFEGLVATATP